MIAVQERHTDAIMATPGIVGTAVCVTPEGHLAIKVYASGPGVTGIPVSFDSMPVVVEETGTVLALWLPPPPLSGCYRPVPIGVSTGNVYSCATGTIGCVVMRNGSKCMLSNNHVIARKNAAQIGEAIAQPGLSDHYPPCQEEPANGCTPRVASLVDFQPISFGGGSNTMDAAVAQYWAQNASCATLVPDFYGYPGSQPVTASLGPPIMKCGRTTRQTQGTVEDINATLWVCYANPCGLYDSALFVGQFGTSKSFAFGGDSGSLVVTDDVEFDHFPVGLLFAGDPTGKAWVSPIAPILQRFSATICTGN
ncbi:MAG: hypothetical protein AB1792_09545 [Candidatus Zixiibacteriota bacterium]